jgi:diacylglycerol kinase family enzyme
MSGTVLVINPRSAGGKTERRWPQFRATILEHFGPFEERFTRAAGDATELTRAALRDGAGLIVAVGGDGTINEVVNGFFAPGDGEVPIARDAAFGILPCGTGGDFIKSLGISKDLAAAARALRGAQARAIDVGRLSFIDNYGQPRVRHFINIASFGIGGVVDRNINQSSKVLGGTLSFAIATLKAGATYNTRTPASSSSSTVALPKRAASTTSPWPTGATSAAA